MIKNIRNNIHFLLKHLIIVLLHIRQKHNGHFEIYLFSIFYYFFSSFIKHTICIILILHQRKHGFNSFFYLNVIGLLLNLTAITSQKFMFPGTFPSCMHVFINDLFVTIQGVEIRISIFQHSDLSCASIVKHCFESKKFPFI